MLQGCRVNHFPRALQSFVHFLLFIRTSQNLSSEVCGGFPLLWHISHSWLGGLFDSLRLCFLSNHLGKIISSDEIKMPQNCSGLDKHRPKTYTLEEEALVPKALCSLGKSQRDGSQERMKRLAHTQMPGRIVSTNCFSSVTLNLEPCFWERWLSTRQPSLCVGSSTYCSG